jgi:hypothetical protein
MSLEHEIDLDDSLYPQGLDWSFDKPSANVPYKIVYIFEKCTNTNRCEECTHCARTKPCSCGCGLLGGSCNKGYQIDTGFADKWNQELTFDERIKLLEKTFDK